MIAWNQQDTENITGPGVGMRRLLGGWHVANNAHPTHYSFDEEMSPEGIFSWNTINTELFIGEATQEVLARERYYRVYAFEYGRQFPVPQLPNAQTELWAGTFIFVGGPPGSPPVEELTGKPVPATVTIDTFHITNNTHLMSLLACAYVDVPSGAVDADGRISLDVNTMDLDPGRYVFRVQALVPENQYPLDGMPPEGGTPSPGPAWADQNDANLGHLWGNIPFYNSMLSGVTLGGPHTDPVSIDNVVISTYFPAFVIGPFAGADSWALDELRVAMDAGLLADRMMGAWQELPTRVEAAEDIVRFALVFTDLETLEELYEYLDLDEAEAWADTPDANARFLRAAGISDGIGGNNFGPTQSFTRAAMVVMLYRLADVLGLDLEDYPLGSEFFDDVPGWAMADEALGWAYAVGITRGEAPGVFNPDGPLQNQHVGVFAIRALLNLQ